MKNVDAALIRNTLLQFIATVSKIAILVVISLLIALSPPLLGSFYTKFVFYPVQEDLKPLAIGDVFCQPLTFASAGGTILTGWYFENPGATKLILVSHGNAGNMSNRIRLAERLLKTHCSVFMYDYEGYGPSPGEPTPSSVCQDGLRAFDYVVSHLPFKQDQIVLYGESIGGAVSTHIATQRRTAGLIIQSGFLSLPDIAKEKFVPFRIFPNIAFYQPHLNNLDALKGPHPPLLIMHGVLDKTVPFRHGQQLAASAASPVTFVPLPNSSHNDTYIADQKLFDEAVQTFLTTLKGS
ncbi:MAG: alpha/beta hydrolase [Candidatus Obscuribacterales bacterium]|nr:alpha/beta hydrolase [Candidatus Obscuribacterales bacterium]